MIPNNSKWFQIIITLLVTLFHKDLCYLLIYQMHYYIPWTLAPCTSVKYKNERFLLYRWVIRKGIAFSDVPVEIDATLEVHFSTDSLPHLHNFIASSTQDSLPLLPFASASAPFILSEHHLSIREGSGLSWVSSSGTLSGILPYVSQDLQ